MSPRQTQARAHRYRTTPEPRLRPRAQMVWRAVEQGLTVPPRAAIVREREATGGRWLKRALAEGLEGGPEAPRPGRPSAGAEAA
ncbi:MAG: helix-turn-helix domain-containing protein, partial [Candidatus Tectomicrobia bacterium]|nr:helix-turn-helix domain-containing protein [Candidatus Tectomicrobia bacterium]